MTIKASRNLESRCSGCGKTPQTCSCNTGNTTHTPGQWQVEERGSLPFIWVKGVGAIAEISGDEFNRPNKAENFANARLIAAAPQLLEALEAALAIMKAIDKAEDEIAWLPGYKGRTFYENKMLIEAAIRSAKGEL